MIVYVDTNFVLELVLLQEEEGACQALLDMNTSSEIELCVPAHAISEATRVVTAKRAERNELLQRIRPVIKDFRRSAHLQAFAENLNDAIDGITATLNDEASRLFELRAMIHEKATTAPLDRAALGWALLFEGMNILSDVDDRMILATVIADAYRRRNADTTSTFMFITRDKKDFTAPGVKAYLGDIALFVSYADAVAHLRHRT